MNINALEGRKMRKVVWLLLGYSVILALPVLAECPSMDVTGDCVVNLADFAVFAEQWLTGDGIPADMVSIPGGTFIMGDTFNDSGSNERPLHIVTVDSFYMGKYEATNQQFCTFLNSTLKQGLIVVVSGIVYKAGSGSSYPYCDTSAFSADSQIAYTGGVFSVRTKIGRSMSNDPMVRVSWYGAVAYCNWRSQQESRPLCYNLSTWNCDYTKNGYRLPTEAEWEYAARGGLSDKRFPWGDTITHSQANYVSSSNFAYDISPIRDFHPTWKDGIMPYTSPKGNFSPNGFGLYDMAGNVWEWCNDWYSSSYYNISPASNPTGPTTGSYRAVRGGGWGYSGGGCRVAFRDSYDPIDRGFGGGGFRVVLGL
jgi:sulfatase modifying factor 1